MADKLNEKELSTLQDQLQKLNDLKAKLGDATLQVSYLTDETKDVNDRFNTFYRRLAKKYNNGEAINIDVTTGDVTPIGEVEPNGNDSEE